MTVAFLGQDAPFPDAQLADDSMGGLLAIGGDLSPQRLLAAYRAGAFPWFDDDHAPILWWSPDPRAVIKPGAMRVSRSLRRRLRTVGFGLSFDRAFAAVVRGCAAPAAGTRRHLDHPGHAAGLPAPAPLGLCAFGGDLA